MRVPVFQGCRSTSERKKGTCYNPLPTQIRKCFFAALCLCFPWDYGIRVLGAGIEHHHKTISGLTVMSDLFPIPDYCYYQQLISPCQEVPTHLLTKSCLCFFHFKGEKHGCLDISPVWLIVLQSPEEPVRTGNWICYALLHRSWLSSCAFSREFFLQCSKLNISLKTKITANTWPQFSKNSHLLLPLQSFLPMVLHFA